MNFSSLSADSWSATPRNSARPFLCKKYRKNVCKIKNFFKNAKNEVFRMINRKVIFPNFQNTVWRRNITSLKFSLFILFIHLSGWSQKLRKKTLKKWVISTNTPKNRKIVTPNLNSWSSYLLLYRKMASFDMRKWYQTFFIDHFESIH